MIMNENPSPPAPPTKKGPRPIIEFDLKLRPADLIRWLLSVGLGAWGGWLLRQQATPFPTQPPSIFSLVLIALGFAAFFFSPETDLEG